METIPLTYALKLTPDEVTHLKRDLGKLQAAVNNQLKTTYWDGVKREYPAFAELFYALPDIDN